MKNSTYWANRFKALEDRQYRKSAAFVEGLKAKFDYADDELETSLYKWYSKLMKNTDAPSLNDAKKLLKENELKEFHWTLEQYEKYAKEHGLDPEWIKKLENASARKHISRYEQIQLQMRQIEEKLYAEYNNECYGYLGELVEDSYYHTAYEIEKGTGIGIDLHKLDRDTVEKYLTHPWCQDGKVFSDRIWQRKDELVRTLDQELTRQLITGADPQKAIDAISDKFDVSKRQAGTLVMTESAAIASEASKDSMKNLGVEEYEILATLDSHTSEICQEMDGQHFRMSEYNPGLTAPPFHPNCRSTTIPYFDDEFTTGETRAARDKNDKDYERVPADMKYGEWKKQYVKPLEADTNEAERLESELGIFKQRIINDENMNKEYYSELKDRFSHGSKDAKRVFNKFIPENSVADSNYTNGAIYKSEEKKIYMNYALDLENPRGVGATWFHEHGHMIDELAGNVSADEQFRLALQKDWVDFLEKQEYNYKQIEEGLTDVRTQSAVSDIINGLSKDLIKGAAGVHPLRLDGSSYWTDDTLAQEAFAHMFEAEFDGARKGQMHIYFPNAVNRFEQLLKGL